MSAGSYKRVMDYFTPEFTLGMIAIPVQQCRLIKDKPIKALDFLKKNSNKFSLKKRFEIREKIVEKLEILNSSIIKFESIYIKW